MLKPKPVILIACFLVQVASLAFPSVPVLLLSTLLLALLYHRSDITFLQSAWMMLHRMRWFLFSILVIYCWFTPGTPLVHGMLFSGWLPSVEGVSSGLQRVLALVLVIASVNLLLRSLSQTQLLAAIYLLVRPLQLIGIKAEVIALRMTLVLETMAAAQDLIATHLPEQGRIPRKARGVGLLAADIFHHVVERASEEKPREVILPPVERPPLAQWLIPVMLWAIFHVSGLLWMHV